MPTAGSADESQRSAYRVVMGEGGPLAASLRLPGGEPLEARLHDVCAGGASLHFPVDACPPIGSGEEVDLTFLERATGRELAARAIIRSLTHGSDHTRVGLEFRDPADFHGELDAPLWSIFNRRRDYRVRPDSASPIRARFEHDGQRYDAPLHDLSKSGLALAIDPDLAGRLARVRRLKLAFQLPGSTPFGFAVRVCHRTPLGEGVVHGFEIDVGSDPVFRRTVISYVLERRKEAARLP